MLVCKDCNRLFEKPEKCYGEQLEYFGFPCREEWLGCPSCGGVYAESFQCDGCGEYIIGKYIKTVDDTYYCENCFSELDTDSD